MTEFITRNYGNENFEIIIKTDSKEHYKATQDFARGLIDHAKPAPTIEAKPVVHAHWKRKNNEMKCSNCEFIYYSNRNNFSFCPHCGAQMDKSISCGHEDDNHDEEMPSGINDSPHPSSPFGESTFPQGKAFEEAERRAEVFKRMAFKLGEEKKILLKIVRKVVRCGWCENDETKFNEEPCRSCGILARNFSPDFEKIEREIEE